MKKFTVAIGKELIRMNHNTEEKTEILADLDEKPVGMFQFRKCITKTTDGSGHVTYSVREYSPRPIRDDEPRYYVPSRGVNLSEDNLKELCAILRSELYDARHAEERMAEFEKEMAETEENEEDSEPIEYDEEEIRRQIEEEERSHTPEELAEMARREEEEYENDDPVDDDVEYELSCEDYGLHRSVTNDDGEEIVLSHLSWHGADSKHDLRVWRRKLNSRGFCELYPEIDQGLQFDDMEAEMLCHEIEKLFPEVLEETRQYIEDDYEKKADTILLNCTERDRRFLFDAVSCHLDRQLRKGLLQGNRGSDVGSSESTREAYLMQELRRKIKADERLSDSECDSLCDILCAERDLTNYDELYAEYDKAYHEIADIIDERGRLRKPEYTKRDRKQLTLSKGECEAAAQILGLLRDELYSTEPEPEHRKQMIDAIDEIVCEDIQIRNENRLAFSDAYKTDAGKHFLEDLIEGFNRASSLQGGSDCRW